MARFPKLWTESDAALDANNWGAILKEYLLVSHGTDGSLNTSATTASSVTSTGSTTARTLADRFSDWINVKDYGAVGDGSTDDTTAVQTAITVGGTIVFPVGCYKITSTLTITKGARLLGLGSGPGGVLTTGSSAHRGAVLDHAFDGTLINITGVSGQVEQGVGSGVENMILRQVAGSGSAAKGAAIKLTAASDTFKPSWVTIRNVSMEIGSGKDDWTYGIQADGASTSGPGAGMGMRDIWIQGVRIATGPNSTGGIAFDGVGNAFISDTLVNNTSGTKGIISLAGTGSSSDANHASASIFFHNVTADRLALGNANGVYAEGMVLADTITFTSSSVRLHYVGGRLVNTPTLAGSGHTVLTTINVTPTWLTSNALALTPAMAVGIAGSTSTALNLAASTTSVSSLRLGHGSAPTSPTNGDLWTTTSGLFVRINGATVGPLAAGGASAPLTLTGSSGITLTLTGTATGGSGAMDMDTTITPGLNNAGAGLFLFPTFQEHSAGTHSFMACIATFPNISLGAAATTVMAGLYAGTYIAGAGVASACGIYVEDAPSSGVANYALFIDAGSVRIDGTDGAGAATGTLTNAPSAGNPDKWIPLNSDGTQYWVPAWAA